MILRLSDVTDELFSAASQIIRLSIIPSKYEFPARFTPSLYRSKLLTEPFGKKVSLTSTPSMYCLRYLHRIRKLGVSISSLPHRQRHENYCCVVCIGCCKLHVGMNDLNLHCCLLQMLQHNLADSIYLHTPIDLQRNYQASPRHRLLCNHQHHPYHKQLPSMQDPPV